MPLALLRGNCPSILIDRSLSEVSKRQAGNCRERPCKSPGNTQRLAVIIIALVVVIIVPQDPEVCPDSQRVSGQAKITMMMMMMMTMTTVIVAILIVIVNKIDKSLNKQNNK